MTQKTWAELLYARPKDELFDPTTHWLTREGQCIPIPELDDSHLLNCIALCERKHAHYVDSVMHNPPCFQGEMAQMAAEDQWLCAASSEPGDHYPSYPYLIQERDRRDLKAHPRQV